MEIRSLYLFSWFSSYLQWLGSNKKYFPPCCLESQVLIRLSGTSPLWWHQPVPSTVTVPSESLWRLGGAHNPSFRLHWSLTRCNGLQESCHKLTSAQKERSLKRRWSLKQFLLGLIYPAVCHTCCGAYDCSKAVSSRAPRRGSIMDVPSGLL